MQASHRTTIEITCEDRVTPRGDCIVLSSSTHDPEKLRRVCEEGEEGVLCVISRFGGFCVKGKCNSFKGSCRVVLRKSNVRTEDTLIYETNLAARDIDRRFIAKSRLWGLSALAILMVY